MDATDTCRFCKRGVLDGSEESGYTGDDPDWMTEDGDFGCDYSPETSEDGVGSHAVTDAEVESKVMWAADNCRRGLVQFVLRRV